jgi:hypothetical protein
LLSTECGRTGDFTIHDAEDGVALLASWVAEQRKRAAASCGDANQKLVLAWCTGCCIASSKSEHCLHMQTCIMPPLLFCMLPHNRKASYCTVVQDMKEVRAQAKEMQRRISLLKNSLPCAYGFSAAELVDSVVALGTVTGEGMQSAGDPGSKVCAECLLLHAWYA